MSLLYNSPCRGPDGRSYKTGLGLTYQNDRLGCLCDVGSTVQHSTLQYSTVHYSTAQYSIHHSAVQFSNAQYSTVQSTKQYSTYKAVSTVH